MSQRNLLVIDDDKVDRMTVIRGLRGTGTDYAVTEAETGRQGIELAARQAFDCILLDYRLPDADGLDVLAELTANPDISVPVVMLTGEGNEMVAVEAMKRGASDYLPKNGIAADTLVRVIGNAVEKHVLQLQLADAHDRLERMALYDELTGLGNRNLFNRELMRAIGSSDRHGQPFGLMLMDLNKFKHVNDTCGHLAGDAVLAAVGRRLLDGARTSDGYFRLGGDEFAAILDVASDEESAKSVAARLKEIVPQPVEFQGHKLSVGISIGWAIYPEAAASQLELVKAADLAMYKDKEGKER